MPKIRIKEKDLTKAASLGQTSNVIFFVDNTLSETVSVPTLASSLSSYNNEFAKTAGAYGADVYVCGTYSQAASYLGDRNQYDVKFLLADETATYSGSDLEYALTITQKRKDCEVILTSLSSALASTTTSALKATISYGSEDATFYADEEKKPVGKYVVPVYGKTLSSSTISGLTSGQAWMLSYLDSCSKGNAEWLAIAGYQRGYIPTVESAGFITEDELNAMQPTNTTSTLAVNPICNVNPWGPRIWGNRTALSNNGLVGSSFANVRLLICDLKKALYKASRKYQFEQNTDVLWVNFQSEVNTLLEEMVQSYGIAGYRWFKQDTDERAKICAVLKIIPIEPVEDFDLTIELADSLEVAE